LSGSALAAARALEAEGHVVTVVDPTWVLPVPETVVDLAREADLVVTLEDNGVHGGAGSAVQQALNEAEVDTPVRHVAVPQEYLDHGSRTEVLVELGMDGDGVEKRVLDWTRNLWGTPEAD
ncbi:transketolase C-terminal domain-containing protein, partial [Corynebacterium bovis]